MEVITAKTAGFCFGVKRAVDTVYEQIRLSETDPSLRPICTYGPIIHNEEVVADLEKKGVQVIESSEEAAGGTVAVYMHNSRTFGGAGAPHTLEFERLVTDSLGRGFTRAEKSGSFAIGEDLVP